MSNVILVTDSLFIKDSHIRTLENAGYTIERLNKVKASEEELCEAIKGKAGYILGGVEEVTETVINSADELKAIVFTGAGYKEFIPSYEMAKKKGIKISNAPGGNSSAVAEQVITMMLAMTRNIFSLGRCGEEVFKTVPSLSSKTVGIVGLGHIGTLVAMRLRALGVDNIRYYSRTRKYYLENTLGLIYSDIDEVFRRSDVVTLHLSKDVGDYYINKKLLSLLPNSSILVNAAFDTLVDNTFLKKELTEGRIRAIYDAPPEDEDFSGLPIYNWYSSNAQTGFNTEEAVETVSGMVTKSMLNLLSSGSDIFQV